MKKSIHSKEYKVLLQQLYHLRVSLGLTQQEFASKLDVPQSFVSKIENGERRLDIIELREICNALDIGFLKFINDFENRLNESK